jgi:hypothetical protein
MGLLADDTVAGWVLVGRGAASPAISPFVDWPTA